MDNPIGFNLNHIPGKELVMELLIADKMREVETITPSQYKKLLKDGGNRKNIFAYGKSGIGKSAIVEEYAKENKLEVIIFSLATEMPEAMGGIPHATQSKEAIEYFARLLDERLAPLFETEGKGYVLFFDEMNQALPEVLKRNMTVYINIIDKDLKHIESTRNSFIARR